MESETVTITQNEEKHITGTGSPSPTHNDHLELKYMIKESCLVPIPVNFSLAKYHMHHIGKVGK